MELDTEVLVPADTEAPTISKNQLKKLKRDQTWEENRAKRKAKRKEKIREKKQRKRAARKEENLTAPIQPKATEDTGKELEIEVSKKPKRPQYEQLPITLVLDCGFDELMMDKERKSLGSQITRCYSDNHKAPYQAHLAVSSFGGHLKERFDGLLAGHYHSWKDVRFLEEDFVEAAAQAKDWMQGDRGGKLAGIFASKHHSAQTSEKTSMDGEVVYLTSDSPNTLTELLPYSTYIIGGLVDRNRHKGICYKRALDRGMKTAKLPIGDYMQMTSRFVLATNQVAEIMLRWLEMGDWGKAFLQVVPKRKGGVLKDTVRRSCDGEVEDEADAVLDDVSEEANIEPSESTIDERVTARDASESQAAKPSTEPEEAAVLNASAEASGSSTDRKGGEVEASSDTKDRSLQA